jgi:hypothetical protein
MLGREVTLADAEIIARVERRRKWTVEASTQSQHNGAGTERRPSQAANRHDPDQALTTAVPSSPVIWSRTPCTLPGIPEMTVGKFYRGASAGS